MSSSSPMLTTESTDRQSEVYGAPMAIADSPNQSRSSSARSVRNSTVVKRRSSSAREPSRQNETQRGATERQSGLPPRMNQLNQQLIYQEAPNAEVVRQAATEVLHASQEVASTKVQAAAIHAQAAEHVASVQARAAHELASVHAQASSAVAGAQVQAVQQLARADFEVREKELLDQIRSLQSQLHAPAVSSGPNGAASDSSRLERLEAKVDYLHSMFQQFDLNFRSKMDQALHRLSQLEEWHDDGQPHVNDDE